MAAKIQDAETPPTPSEIPSRIWDQLIHIAQLGYQPRDVQQWYRRVFQDLHSQDGTKGEANLSVLTTGSENVLKTEDQFGGLFTSLTPSTQSNLAGLAISSGLSSVPESLSWSWPSPSPFMTADNTGLYPSGSRSNPTTYETPERLEHRRSQLIAMQQLFPQEGLQSSPHDVRNPFSPTQIRQSWPSVSAAQSSFSSEVSTPPPRSAPAVGNPMFGRTAADLNTSFSMTPSSDYQTILGPSEEAQRDACFPSGDVFEGYSSSFLPQTRGPSTALEVLSSLSMYGGNAVMTAGETVPAVSTAPDFAASSTLPFRAYSLPFYPVAVASSRRRRKPSAPGAQGSNKTGSPSPMKRKRDF